MQAGVGLLVSDVMPICMIIALDIVMTLRNSINCSTVIHSPTVILAIMREASSEHYGPRVYLPSYICYLKYKNTKNTLLHIYFIYFILLFIYHILHLLFSEKGLTTPYRVGCKLFVFCAGALALYLGTPTGLITLVLN